VQMMGEKKELVASPRETMRFSLPLLLALALGALAGASIPLPVQHYTEQLVDHFRGATLRDQDALRRRIICIVGGEGDIPESTGVFYPWVGNDLAQRLKALVIEPEHRFYGVSIPAGERGVLVLVLLVVVGRVLLAVKVADASLQTQLLGLRNVLVPRGAHRHEQHLGHVPAALLHSRVARQALRGAVRHQAGADAAEGGVGNRPHEVSLLLLASL